MGVAGGGGEGAKGGRLCVVGGLGAGGGLREVPLLYAL